MLQKAGEATPMPFTFNASTQQTVMALKTVWDSSSDAKEFAASFEKYATRRFGKPASQKNDSVTWSGTESFTGLFTQGSQTIWIFAPDIQTALSIKSLAQNP